MNKRNTIILILLLISIKLFSQPCIHTLNYPPESASIPPAGGAFHFEIQTSQNTCDWHFVIEGDSSWYTVMVYGEHTMPGPQDYAGAGNVHIEILCTENSTQSLRSIRIHFPIANEIIELEQIPKSSALDCIKSIVYNETIAQNLSPFVDGRLDIEVDAGSSWNTCKWQIHNEGFPFRQVIRGISDHEPNYIEVRNDATIEIYSEKNNTHEVRRATIKIIESESGQLVKIIHFKQESALPPDRPAPPTVVNNCGNSILTRGNPPLGVTWYWQESDNGESTVNSSQTYTVEIPANTYNYSEYVYLRAKNNSTGLWSNSTKTLVYVKDVPPKPYNVWETDNCGTATLNYGSSPTGDTWYWQGTSSSGTSETNSTTNYIATTSGTYYLRARDNGSGCWSTLSSSIAVTVNEIPPQPTGTIAVSNNCGNSTLTSLESPPTGLEWYWQGNSSNGTSKRYPSPTYTATSDGTYYLRANNEGCWSSTSLAVTVNVKELPGTPSIPTVTNNCGNSILARGNPPAGITWYWQGTSSAGTSTSNSSATYTVTNSGTYYLRARNNTTGCWSAASSIVINILEIPVTPGTPTITNACGETILGRLNPPMGVTWYWQGAIVNGTSTSNSSVTYKTTVDGTYYLRARNNSSGCWSSSSSAVTVDVNELPDTPDAISVNGHCGSSILTRNAPPIGVTWYWQESANGQSTINSSNTLTAIIAGVIHYLRAQNNTSGCWSSSSSSTTANIDEIPGVPTVRGVYNNCGSTTINRNNPPVSETWYWQGLYENGTDKTKSSLAYVAATDGTYYLRAWSTGGCWSADKAIVVDVKELPAIPATPTVTNNCGNSVLKRLTPPTGVTWYWQTSETGEEITNSNIDYTVTNSGTYYLRGKDNVTNCWGNSVSIIVSVREIPALSITSDKNAVDQGVVVNLTASGANTYVWDAHEYMLSASGALAEIRPYATSIYSVTGTNTNNCSLTAQIEIEVLPFTVAIEKSGTVGNEILTAIPSSGIAPYTYLWSSGERAQSIGLSPESVYTVSVTDNLSNTTNTTYTVVGVSTYHSGGGEGCDKWTENKVFDGAGNVVAHSVTYYDNMGRGIQSLAKNISGDKTIVTQVIYDAMGRPVVSTLPAAISNPNLSYSMDFITNTIGQNYTYEDFDGTYLDDPKAVNTNIPNTLGWYYSGHNTPESHVPTTKYPYTRVEYSKITGQARRGALAGEHHRMGNSHHNETMGFTMPASDEELSTVKTAMGIDLEITGLVKSVGVDAMDKISVSYTNSDGNLIASCIGTGGTVTTIAHKIPANVGYIDVYLFNGNINLPGSNTYTITDLVSENMNTRPLSEGFYRVKVNETLSNDLSFTLDIANTMYALNVYNKVGRLKEVYSPLAVANGDNTQKSTYTYNVLGWLLETTSPDQGTSQYVYRKDGSIRFSQNAKQLIDGTFSYTNYDDAGRIIEVGEYIETTSIKFSTLTGEFDLPDVTANKQDVSNTYYDVPYDGWDQHFVAGKVAKTKNKDVSTWYSYTYDGKIDWVLQNLPEIGDKWIDYEYDFNGNVTRVIYQKDDPDYDERFDHIYAYDSDLRLDEVKTQDYQTNGTANEEQPQAKYFYYAHGPLKRVEIADGLQGIDYVYNINGWLKGINHPSLLISNDPGGDDNDLFGMSLDYYSGDYTRSGVNYATTSENNLYDGNIKAQHWQTRTSDAGMNPGANQQWLSTYTYNNLNYMATANFGTFDRSVNMANVSAMVDNISYDANGNLITLNRHANGNTFDEFTYNYNNAGKPNQLSSLVDAAPDFGYNDILLGTEGFTYDNIGQMTERTSGNGLEEYEYDVYGKVTKIKYDGALKAEYSYDEKGFRVKKKVYGTGSTYDETWYARDLSGNLLSIYASDNGATAIQTELPIYGSGRIGTSYKTDNQSVYELTDHLGNVRATFGRGSDGILQLYDYADYHPFGMRIPGRYKTAGKYRFGYQGQFAEDETNETGYNAFEARLWDARIGRWTAPDPAGQYHSPYLGMGNNPISGVDPDGKRRIFYNADGSHNLTDKNNWFHNLFYGNQHFIKNTDGGWTSVNYNQFQEWQSEMFPKVWDSGYLTVPLKNNESRNQRLNRELFAKDMQIFNNQFEINKIHKQNLVMKPIFEAAYSISPAGWALDAMYAINGEDIMGNKLTTRDRVFFGIGAIVPGLTELKVIKQSVGGLFIFNSISNIATTIEVGASVNELNNTVHKIK